MVITSKKYFLVSKNFYIETLNLLIPLRKVVLLAQQLKGDVLGISLLMFFNFETLDFICLLAPKEQGESENYWKKWPKKTM
jgi:hypothetical protein